MEAEDKWVQQKLSSLDGIRRAEANPYLYEKIKNRLAVVTISYAIKPAIVWLSAACLAALISLNVLSISHFTRQNTLSNNNKAVFANDYFSYLDNN